MAYKTAPKFTYVWAVTYKFGHTQDAMVTDDIVAFDIPELMERWDRHVAKNLKYTIRPTVVKVERGKSLYA